ncbi:hypothetical protein DSO57_1031103 [Entomophthora muscae]|uniref:Uncharacterized protein n=1 Tax=Entomophthora muscae TaxID=34485 RepID=A0ACC2RFH0_9FUNG|nr:hypothetical protein DSO57_1031103 [Entomophthora muscae]
MPLLEPLKFFQLLEVRYPSLPLQALITAVALIGAAYVNLEASIKNTQEVLGTRLRKLLSQIYLKPCIYSVQTFLLASHWQISNRNTKHRDHSWIYYTMACGMAKMLGFHIGYSKLGTFQVDERTRVWMAIYMTGIGHHVFGEKPYLVSSFNHDVKLWKQETDPLLGRGLYKNDKYIVHSFRSSTIQSALVESMFRVKTKYASVSNSFLKTGDITPETRTFFMQLDQLEANCFSWYKTLPPFLLSRAKATVLASPSVRNPFACKLYAIFFFSLLYLNRMKISPNDLKTPSFDRLNDISAISLDVVSVSDFLTLSPLEKCLVISHLGTSMLSSPHHRKSVLHGTSFKWIVAFQIALFLNLLKQLISRALTLGFGPHDPQQATFQKYLDVIVKDEATMMDLFSKGSLRISILKDSFDFLSQINSS